MGLTKKDRENLKNYIINNVDKFPKAIATQTAKKFGISRQAVNRHIRQLKNNNILTCAGKGRSTQYALKETMQAFSLQVFPGMSEDQVWRDRVVPFLPPLKKNVLDICNHGFTEMLNNVIDHSEAKKVFISLEYNAKNVHFQINDSGVGIFNKIQKALKLEDPHHAILELAKGKFTTDPDSHSGEGIFFTSRIFDAFEIISFNLYFSGYKDDDWISEAEQFLKDGTAVFMVISRNSKTEIKNVFEEYASGDNDYGFSKTIIPVRLMRHEGQELVSRSQAKRLITRFDEFKEVILDFNGVQIIGQAFADELFRVFRMKYPEVYIVSINTSEAILKSIAHVTAEIER